MQTSPVDDQELLAVTEAFSRAANRAHFLAPAKARSQKDIHAVAYRVIRQEFGLSANLAVRAIARVKEARASCLKAGHEVKEFRPTSVAYDARIFWLRGDVFSLTTLHGRKQYKVHLTERDHILLASKAKPVASATLHCRKDKSWWIHVHVTIATPALQPVSQVIGVDLGRTDIAVTSTGMKFSGKQVTDLRERFTRVQTEIQIRASQGTRSGRRRCRQLQSRLAGREKRFVAWRNHNVSKAIVAEAVRTESAIALEDLTGIRERTNQQFRGRLERRRSNSWAFHQLRRQLEYKAVLSGVEIILVSPAYTSQSCHECLWLGYRQGKAFACLNPLCGWVGDADFNGACMIASVWAAVSQPGGPSLACDVQAWLRATENPGSVYGASYEALVKSLTA
jgi:IS605 OrfB family transposase